MTSEGYPAASAGAAFFPRVGRRRIRVSGPDRARFLHNLTTNDVKRRLPGQGCETFITSPQGKTLGLVTLLVGADEILLRTEDAGFDPLLAHLAKYGMFDDVQIADITAETDELHLVGPGVPAVLDALGLPAPDGPPLTHARGAAGEPGILVIRESPTGRPGWSLLVPSAFRESFPGELFRRGTEWGLVQLKAEDWEALRIEAGTPVFGRDVTAENLPQEVGRDEQAISFVKGCYLGQETVARIDALGHVNRMLRGLTFEPGSTPGPGAILTAGERSVGTLTSVVHSPGWGCPIALGYVRTSHAEPGQTVDAGGSTGTVRALPMRPGG